MKENCIDIGKYHQELENTGNPIINILEKATYLAEEISNYLKKTGNLAYIDGQVPTLQCKGGEGGSAEI